MIIEPLIQHDPAATLDPRSAAFEVAWLPVAGPTAVALVRLTPLLWTAATPFEAPDLDVAKMLGLPTADSVRRAADRLAHKGLGSWDRDTGRLGVWTSMRRPSERQLARAAGLTVAVTR